MHIAMYIGSLQAGGAERVMKGLAEALYARGHCVTLVTTYLADKEYTVAHGCWQVVNEAEEGTLTTGASPALNNIGETVLQALDPGEHPARVRFMLPQQSADPSDPSPSGPACTAVNEDRDGAVRMVVSGTGQPLGVVSLDHTCIGRVFSGISSAEAGGRIRAFRERQKRLREIWDQLRPDVILSFIGKNNLMALLTARRIPVVVSVRATPLEEYPTALMQAAARVIFPRAAAVAVQSGAAGVWFGKRISERAVVVPNAIASEFLADPPEPAPFEREKTIVFVGRLDANKNAGMLLRAFASLLSDAETRETAGQYHVRIYGDGSDRQELEKLAGTLGIKDKVTFYGVQHGIAEKIRRAGIYCLTSGQEGMPNALIEAMCLGVPSITTDCIYGGVGQVVTDKENALVIPPRDEAALAAALRCLMEDPELADRLGTKARELRSRYAPDEVTDLWEDILKRAARGEGLPRT